MKKKKLRKRIKHYQKQIVLLRDENNSLNIDVDTLINGTKGEKALITARVKLESALEKQLWFGAGNEKIIFKGDYPLNDLRPMRKAHF